VVGGGGQGLLRGVEMRKDGRGSQNLWTNRRPKRQKKTRKRKCEKGKSTRRDGRKQSSLKVTKSNLQRVSASSLIGRQKVGVFDTQKEKPWGGGARKTRDKKISFPKDRPISSRRPKETALEGKSNPG